MERVRCGCAAVVLALAGAASSANAFQAMMDGHGQGQIRGSVWAFPNNPTTPPTYDIPLHEGTELQLGPELQGADPRTRIFVQGSGNMSWNEQAVCVAASGDTVDWHSMLPYINATSTDATGSMMITGTILTPTSALFQVTWSASDAGVAMHIGWFEGDTELFETPVMVGPFSRVDNYVINSTGPIDLVKLETSMGATSLPAPAPGAAALLGLAGVLTARRRR
jgi:MYXO-CTERM domain-containing protein